MWLMASIPRWSFSRWRLIIRIQTYRTSSSALYQENSRELDTIYLMISTIFKLHDYLYRYNHVHLPASYRVFISARLNGWMNRWIKELDSDQFQIAHSSTNSSCVDGWVNFMWEAMHLFWFINFLWAQFGPTHTIIWYPVVLAQSIIYNLTWLTIRL